MTIELPRRTFITSLIALVAAPAIVRVGSLMPVKTVVWSTDDLLALLEKRLDHVAKILSRNLEEAIWNDVRYNSPGMGLAGLLKSEGVAPHRAIGTLYPFREITAGFSLNG